MENNEVEIDYEKVYALGQSILLMMYQMEFTFEEVHELLNGLYDAHMKAAEVTGIELDSIVN